MKLILSTAAALMLGTSAFAGPFGLPDHQPNGYRDTGCDPDFQVDLGGYSNNPTCPAGKGATDAPEVEVVVVPPEDDDDGEGEGSGDDNGGDTDDNGEDSDDNGGESDEGDHPKA